MTMRTSSHQDDDEDQSLATTTDEFLAELKEEVVLQSLLHKRILERKERVFQLEHRNGRRLRVVLPPDTQSVASFEEEAKKTDWVSIMLNTEDRLEGMLLHLAKKYPIKYQMIGKKRKLSM
jgi:membrane-bound lytic murein transglycosylase MltF